ncbi:ATP-dependent RNA helicase HrpA [Thiotrichales bacterium 19S3-7]|nr:ATP-dependent RNA helicase HrpA [Thiotrichales bacterium 19S3-7]MCF6801260.1 ATP-dependent RNA helicase HrpA [Thiotrichales bacterium 19S3-11]
MASSLSELREKLNLITSESRGLVIKSIRQLTALKNQKVSIDDQLRELQEIVDSLIAIVEEKKLNRPKISYPNLPVTDQLDKIKQVIAENQVIIVAGETGSGKSTQLPKICLDLGLGCRGFIGHTQPRRLAARSVAQRISEELNCQFGSYVGYKVRFNDKTSEQTYIKVMTDGILLAELQTDRYLSQYDTIIIDEAHERSLNIDFLLGYLKFLLPKRKDLKVIITSATIDQQRFSNYFNQAPIIEVSGRTYPVEIRYHEDWQENETSDNSQSERILDAINELSLDGHGDILVFFATEREIYETKAFLDKANLKQTDVLPLYARLSTKEQQKIFQPFHKRRIILSTNVAETSVTVPGIRYVIDTGKVRISRYNYRNKVQRLPIEPISQASANQRAGRCGRVADGICIRLYAEDDYLSRSEFTDPEILRTNLASVILKMKALSLGNIEDFPFVEAPDGRFIKDGFRLLHELNAMTDNHQLTELGKTMALLPIEPRFARMLIEAKQKGALNEILIIVSFLSIHDPRERPKEFQEASYQKHLVDRDKQSDFITILNLWKRINSQSEQLSNNQFKRYCRVEFLSFLRIREWRDIYTQLSELVGQLKWRINQSNANDDLLHQAIISGLLSHIGFNHDQKEYLGARGLKFSIFPGSFVFKETPKWIVASDLIETSKLYARVVTKIKVEWLEKLAQHLVKRHYSEAHWRNKTQDVAVFERVSLYGLDIVQKRIVSYGKIKPAESREIFIRDALVGDNLKTNAAFYQHNLDLLDDIDDLENKARRRDIMVDEGKLYDFYDQHIPEHIYNLVTFNQWYKTLPKDKQQALYFDFSDVTQTDTSAINQLNYPNHFEVNGLKLPLNYHFDPSNHADGITMTVPLPLIDRIATQQTDWLVPGMLEDKITALIRALPKQIRKYVLPISHYAKALTESIPYNPNQNLRQQLANELIRITGVHFEPAVWDQANIEPYLMMNYSVVDAKGKLLKEGRNLREIISELKHKKQLGNHKTLKQQPENANTDKLSYQQWEFDMIDEMKQIKQFEVVSDVYPCLTDCENGVKLTYANTLKKAKVEHFYAIKRLLDFQCRHLYKTVKKNIKNKQQLALYFSKITKREDQWIEDVFQASLIYGFRLRDDMTWQVRDYNSFEALLKEGKGSVVHTSENIIKLLNQIMPLYYEINKKLTNQNVPTDHIQSYQDMKSQLDAMIYQGFISKTEQKWFERLTFYLLSIQARLEKLPRNLSQDRQFMADIDDIYDQLDRQIEQQNLADDDRAIIEVEWLIQELWLSYYGQQYKTIQPVSTKRISKIIDQIK